MIINDKNIIRSTLENLNEAKTVNLGGGSVAYKYNGKYYIKKGDSKKEISSDQYQKLLSKDNSKKDKNSKDSDKGQIKTDQKSTDIESSIKDLKEPEGTGVSKINFDGYHDRRMTALVYKFGGKYRATVKMSTESGGYSGEYDSFKDAKKGILDLNNKYTEFLKKMYG